MSLKFKLIIPKPNKKWWNDSKAEILNAVKEYNQEAWSKQVDPVSQEKWQPRKKPTGSHPLLNKSGKMFRSTEFKATSKPMMFNAIIKVPYGGFHQKGTSKMPQRRWLGIGGKITPKLVPILKEHLFKGTYTFTTS